MSEVIEEIFTGYCKAYNKTQIITCEYEKLPFGLGLVNVDCDYEKCVHNGNCEVIRQALAKEEEDI